MLGQNEKKTKIAKNFVYNELLEFELKPEDGILSLVVYDLAPTHDVPISMVNLDLAAFFPEERQIIIKGQVVRQKARPVTNIQGIVDIFNLNL